MGKTARIVLVLVIAIVAFIGLANSAVWLHGLPMIVGIGPWAWAVSRWLGWATSR